MPTVQPPSDATRNEPSPERRKIVLDERFLAAAAPAIVDSPPAGRQDAAARRLLDRTAGGWARVWRVVLLGLTAVSALGMIAFALMKAVPPTALCMLALVVVKIADQWNSRRLPRLGA
ncbi:hypothetical protein L1857_29705 [Amycolatopsis thermalba]|uniref:Uncharacterized protein n=1 Tax=Amycolatopsis thermalba TaxID=944492 RepID=A0ABY4P374_9PSEU|nr:MULTISPECIES: hypothetical protein [Amycolatopsis]UQS26683.1 hypothetical protein L1857_29705 [Amycolatopsis thermalba]